MGLAAVRRLDPVQLIEQALPALVAETGYTALLTVWSNRGPTVVHWQRSRNPFVTNLGLGSVLPVSRSATGAVLVAFLPEAVTADAIAAGRKTPLAAAHTRPAASGEPIIPDTCSVTRAHRGAAR